MLWAYLSLSHVDMDGLDKSRQLPRPPPKRNVYNISTKKQSTLLLSLVLQDDDGDKMYSIGTESDPNPLAFSMNIMASLVHGRLLKTAEDRNLSL